MSHHLTTFSEICLPVLSVHSVSCRHYYILSQVCFKNKLKLALIGQSLFGKEVYSHLQKEGHRVVGVFTVPDKDGKADPLGEYTWEHWVKHSQGWWVIRAAFVACDPLLLLGHYQDEAFIAMVPGSRLSPKRVNVPASKQGKEGTGKMVPSVKGFPHKLEDLSSDPQHSHQVWCPSHVCFDSIVGWRWRQGNHWPDNLTSWQALGSVKRPCLRK